VSGTLKAEPSIRCDVFTGTYRRMFLVGAVSIIVYGIGIPLIYAFFLRRHRAAIRADQVPHGLCNTMTAACLLEMSWGFGLCNAMMNTSVFDVSLEVWFDGFWGHRSTTTLSAVAVHPLRVHWWIRITMLMLVTACM
jgi:hypothetical protein